MTSPSSRSTADGWLLRQASQAAVWNALLLPVLAVANLALSVLIRRRFGLASGAYDIVLGLATALLVYSGLGIPGSLSKFLPEVAASSPPATLRHFLLRAALIRVAVLGALLLPLNLWDVTIADGLGLGPAGPVYLRWLSLLVVGRACLDLAIKTLNAFFAQLWSNSFALAQAVLDVVVVGTAIAAGYSLSGVLAGLTTSAALIALASAVYVWSRLDSLSRRDADKTTTETTPHATVGAHLRRLGRFGIFTYVIGLLGFFTDMGFVAPALALTLSTEEVALFATAFKLSFMTMTFVIAGFRGLYQPVFARLRGRNDPAQLRRAFSVITKGQLIVLLPAGTGLAVMSGDYIPLLFGGEFQPAVPIARVLIAAMFTAVIVNVPGILLTVDERYRAVFAIQSIPVLTAPVFILAAGSGGLPLAAGVFGGARVGAALASYAVCRRIYDIRFPWMFAARVGIASVTMGLIIGVARTVWATSPTEAFTLTGAGVLVFAFGLRVSQSLGPDEIDLMRRSGIPGHRRVIAWLTPGASRP